MFDWACRTPGILIFTAYRTPCVGLKLFYLEISEVPTSEKLNTKTQLRLANENLTNL